MKTATKNLEDDHVHILRLISVMEHITHNRKGDIAQIEKIVEIIRNFADGLHHAKEENLFFPFLGNRGFSSAQGPVAVMLNEHIQGRNFVKEISENIVLFKNGNEAALNEVFTNMKGYAELLKNHISKENNILFRMANNALSESDHESLLISFGEAERKHLTAFGTVDYIKQIGDLSSFYDIG
jgi:hemerythrin-like domain-containing protein